MRHATWIWLAVAFGTLTARLWAAPAPNDSFNNRIVLTGTNITTAGSNTNASKQNGEPDHAGNSGGKSVWWAWTAPSNGDLAITTDGSDFDTLLGVYTGSSVSALSLVASNDDHGVFVTGRVRFEALADTQYQIAVDGYSDTITVASGNITLTLVFIPEPIPRPPNDNFASRIAVTGLPLTLTGTNVMATRERGEPLHADGYGDTSAWWSWTAPSNERVSITTAGSTFDTLLAVYTGLSVSNLSLVAASDDTDPANGVLTSALMIDTTASQAYQIAVDGYDGDSGQVVLSIGSVTPRLINPGWVSNGVFQFTIMGALGTTNEVEASEDLKNWTSMGTLVNTDGAATFMDPTATNCTPRFYRALLR